jgi:hypothetical protein
MVKAIETPLFAIYVHQLFALAKAVRDNCDLVFLDTPLPETGYSLKVSVELHARIDAILIGAANIKKLIQTPAKRGSSEPKRVYELRQDRGKVLRAIVDGLTLDEVLNTKVRNSLEHFDEYLDEINASLATGEPASAPMAAFNMVFSHREMIYPEVYPIRVYVVTERKYYNMKNVIDLGSLREQAASVVERLQSLGFLRDDTEPGGLMVLLPNYKP